MTKDDAKEIIKMLVGANGKEITPFIENVLKIIDMIDVGKPNLTYVPNVGDTYIDKCMSDKDMFRIHPESGPFYGKDLKDSYANGPKDCYGNPVPYCGVNEPGGMSGTPIHKYENTISTSKDSKLTC